eukprot:12313441-Karenia_brevis.AAC.1
MAIQEVDKKDAENDQEMSDQGTGDQDAGSSDAGAIGTRVDISFKGVGAPPNPGTSTDGCW